MKKSTYEEDLSFADDPTAWKHDWCARQYEIMLYNMHQYHKRMMEKLKQMQRNYTLDNVKIYWKSLHDLDICVDCIESFKTEYAT